MCVCVFVFVCVCLLGDSTKIWLFDVPAHYLVKEASK